MSKFFVGQRVRKARGSVNVGLEGVVVGLRAVSAGTELHTPFGIRRLGHDSDIQIRYVSNWLTGQGRVCPSSYASHGIARNYEPIQPTGAAPSELSYTELMDRLKAGEVECV